MLVAVVALAACGGASPAAQPVTGDGFRFEAPGGWKVERTARLVRASDGDVDLVSVRAFPLVKAYRPELFAATSRELDRAASELADQLGGNVAGSDTVRAAGGDVRSYRIEYDGKVEEITFVLRGKREYELLCRRDADGSRNACKRLVRTFEPA